MFDIRIIPTKKGDAYIAEFETEDNYQCTAWMPDSLVKKFKALKVKECYVFNKGKKENGSKSYFDTTLFPMDWQEEILQMVFEYKQKFFLSSEVMCSDV